jgi:hypothetical protein
MRAASWEYSARMTRLVSVLVAASLSGLAADAQVVRYIDGVFVAPKGGTPIELIAYAEARSTGILRMSHGTLEDAPLVHEVVSVLASLPQWRPQSVTISTEEIFRDERAERRGVVFAVTKLNVYALGLRISDLEERARIDALLRAVRASATNPGYAFIGMESDGAVRYYPMRLTPMEK